MIFKNIKEKTLQWHKSFFIFDTATILKIFDTATILYRHRYLHKEFLIFHRATKSQGAAPMVSRGKKRHKRCGIFFPLRDTSGNIFCMRSEFARLDRVVKKFLGNFVKDADVWLCSAQVLPTAIRDKRDVLGAAETGSGKTLAFGIPLLHHLMEDKNRNIAVTTAVVKDDQSQVLCLDFVLCKLNVWRVIEVFICCTSNDEEEFWLSNMFASEVMEVEM